MRANTSFRVLWCEALTNTLAALSAWPFDSVFCLCLGTYRFNHELVFGISVKNLTKAERLIYGDSLMTHAMILTAVTDKVC